MGVVARQTTLTAIVSYIGALIGLVNKFLLFPNILSASEVGLANILPETGLLLAQFSLMGSSGILLKYFPQFNNKKKKYFGFLTFNSLLALFGFLFMFILLLIFKVPFTNFFSARSPEFASQLPYLIILAFCMMMFFLYSSFLRSLYKVFVPALLNEVVSRLMVTVCIGLFAWGIIDFKIFLFLFVAVTCLPFVLLIIYMTWLGESHFLYPPQKEVVAKAKPMIKYGIALQLNIIVIYSLLSLDAVIIAGLIGMKAVGIYTTALYATSFILIPGRVLINASAPRITEQWEAKDIEKVRQTYGRVTNINSVVGLALFFGLWLNFDSLFSFLPPEYLAAKWPLFFLGLSRVVDMTTGLNLVLLMLTRHYWLDFVFNAVLLSSSIGLKFLLIPDYGIEGAAFTTFLCYSIVNILRVIFLLFFYKIQPASWATFGVIVFAIIAYAIAWFIPLIDNKFADIFIRSVVFMVLFLGPVISLKLSPDLASHSNNLASKVGLRRKK